MMKNLFSSLFQTDPLELLREKRRAPRKNTQEQVLVRVGGLRSFTATCLDHNQGGVRLELPPGQSLKVGDVVEVKPRLSGRVAWVRKVGKTRQVGVAGQPPNTVERRRYVRVPVKLTALCLDTPVRVLDMSLRGMRIEIDEKLRVGPTYDFHLKLPDRPLSFSAVVLETRPSLKTHVARLHIPTLDDRNQKRISNYLAGALRS